MWEYLVIFFRLPIFFLYISLITVFFIPFIIITTITFINFWLLALFILPIALFILIVINNKAESLSYLKFLCGVYYVRFINSLLELTFEGLNIFKNWTFYDDEKNEEFDVFILLVSNIVYLIVSIGLFLLSSLSTWVILEIIYAISREFNIENQIFRNIIFYMDIIYKYFGFS